MQQFSFCSRSPVFILIPASPTIATVPYQNLRYGRLASLAHFYCSRHAINFVNLNTVLIYSRGKEVGVRKILGSSRFKLITRFLMETLLTAVVALFVSLAVVDFGLLYLPSLLGYELHMDLFSDGMLLAFRSRAAFFYYACRGIVSCTLPGFISAHGRHKE